MKILVTGGHGFLGKHITKELIKHGYDIYDGYALFNQPWQKPQDKEVWRPGRVDFDATSQLSADWGVQAFQPDVILHMAALCGGILANKNSPADFLHKNVDMSSNIFHAAHKHGCKRVYTLGSVCAYPKHCPTPFKEDDLWNGYPEETNAPYGMSKRLLLMLGQTYRQQYGIGGVHFIPVNMYGEHDHFDLTNSHVIPALIRKFDTAIEKNLSTVECWGTGEATREFLYAGDAAEAIIKAINNELDTSLPINLGTGKDISIKDLSHLIGDLSGFTGEIVFNGAVSDGQPRRMLDVSRAKDMMGWAAKTDLKTGLLKTIQWFRENKQQIIAADAS